MTLAALPDDDFAQEPLFPVEPADKNAASEIQRQATFLALMKRLAPDVLVYANVNAAKRGAQAARNAKREGMRKGVFDLTVVWNRGVAWPEFKAGKGRLSPDQVEFGNGLVRRGHHAACFRDPMTAVDWLRSLGCPIREARG